MGMSMVTICIILLAISLICLVVEMFLPGFGFFGISGIILMLLSAVLAVMYIPFGWMFVAAEAALLVLFGSLIFARIRKRQLYGKLILNENLNEAIPDIGSLESLIGKEGKTLTPLRPFGDAEFNGKQLEICSQGPFIARGVMIKGTGINNNRIVVKEV
jgi:membrane-bound serine protease (ClpP class)